jgi:hypothetical protein
MFLYALFVYLLFCNYKFVAARVGGTKDTYNLCKFKFLLIYKVMRKHKQLLSENALTMKFRIKSVNRNRKLTREQVNLTYLSLKWTV